MGRVPKKKGNKDNLPKKKVKKSGNKTNDTEAKKKRNVNKNKTESRSSKKPVAKKNRSGPDGGFKIGDNVELKDITKKPELNGKRGVIKGVFDKRKKRWPVNVKDGDAFRILKMQSINLRKLTKEEIAEMNKPKPKMKSLRNELKIGDAVELYNIEKKPEYNGLTGTIAEEFDKKKRRWPVMVESLGKVVKVEPKNVRKYEEKIEKKSEEEENENNGGIINENEINVPEETTINFKIGDTVELHGIDKKPEYNGLLGIINGPFNESKNRWPLKLENNGKIINLQEKNIKLYEEEELGDFDHQVNDGNFKVGDRVELQNVKKNEYNGLLGEITEEFDIKKCRWTITLEANGKKIRLPPDQLKIAPEDDLASIESLDLKIDDGGFKIGDRIELIAVAKNEYNGLLGVIDGEFDTKKSFWPVQLDQGGRILNFKPNNLIPYKEQKLENLNQIQQIPEESFKLVQLSSTADVEDSISGCPLNSAVLDFLHDKDGASERRENEDDENIVEVMMDLDDEDHDIPTVPFNLHSAAINVALEEETLFTTPISSLPSNSKMINSLIADESNNEIIVTDDGDDESDGIPTLSEVVHSDATINSIINTEIEEEDEDEDVDHIPTLQNINSEVFRVAMEEPDNDNSSALSSINSEAMRVITGESDGLILPSTDVLYAEMEEEEEEDNVDHIPTLQTINSEAFRVAMEEHDEDNIPTLSGINSEAMRIITEGDGLPSNDVYSNDGMEEEEEEDDVDHIPTLQTINSEAFRVAMEEHDEDNIPTLSGINSEAMRVITEGDGLPSNDVYSNEVSDTGMENEIKIPNQIKSKKDFRTRKTTVSLESFTAISDANNEKNVDIVSKLFSQERDANLTSPIPVLRKKSKKHRARDSVDRSRYDFNNVDGNFEEQRMKSAESDVSNEQVLNMFKEDAFSKSLPNVSAIDMATLANVLPTDATPEHQRERIRIFEEMDTYGQKKISRYDIEKNSHIMFDRRVVGISEAIRNSFEASKCILPGKDPELLTFLEYETFLICLRRYFEITEAFSSCTNNSKLDYDEFRRCLPLLNRWGCVSQYPRDDFVYLVEIGEEFLDFHILRRWLLTTGLQETMTAFVAKGEQDNKKSFAKHQKMKEIRRMILKEKKSRRKSMFVFFGSL